MRTNWPWWKSADNHGYQKISVGVLWYFMSIFLLSGDSVILRASPNQDKITALFNRRSGCVCEKRKPALYIRLT